MKKITFSNSAISKLEAPASGRVEYADAGLQGLRLRVSSSGAKRFSAYRYHPTKKKPVRVNIGPFPTISVADARKKCAEILREMFEGTVHADERRKISERETIGEAWRSYLEFHCKSNLKPKSVEDYELLFQNHLSGLAGSALEDVSRKDVMALHQGIVKQGSPYAANRALALLRAIYNFAIKCGYEGSNPATLITKAKEKPRDRFLLPDEVPRFIEQCNVRRRKGDRLIADALLVALFTGTRIGNVQTAEWDHVDFERRVWSIPDTKNNQGIKVYLSDFVMEILEGRPRTYASPFVFWSYSSSKHLEEPRYQFKDICKKAEIEGFRIHDLKRTFVSYAYSAGLNPIVVQRLAGHKSGNITERVYGQATEDQIRAGYQAVADALLAAGREKKTKKRKGNSDHEPNLKLAK